MVEIEQLKDSAKRLARDSEDLHSQITSLEIQAHSAVGIDPLIFAITVFVLACFVGYYVVWRVTPALHTPLMSVTNAISGVVIVGAILAVGPAGFGFSQAAGFIAVVIASINIFGGFIVTQRMLAMFKKKEVAPKGEVK